MLKKEYRLPSSGFKKVYRKGRTKKGTFVILKYLENQKNFSRFGFVISKAVSQKAIYRNLLRRRANEAIRSFFEKVKPGFDFVIIFKKESQIQDLKKELESLLNV